MSDHPIEALLRPPAELTTGVVSLTSAAIAAVSPELFLVTPSVGYGAGLTLMIYGAWWTRKGINIVRYQRNLGKLRQFEMASKDIPTNNNDLYLGLGFDWEEKHTQRLHDTRRTRFKKFIPKPKKGAKTDGLTTLHGVEPDEKNVCIPLADRNGHTLILGTTRVGKTRGLEIMVTQDIHRGDVVVVIDPKGDADLLMRVRAEAEKAGRGSEFYMFHLGYPELSCRYNGIGSFNRITEIASRLSGQLSAEGNSAVFREFAWRFINIVAKAEVALGRRPDYKSILKNVTNIDDIFIEYAEYAFRDVEDFQDKLKAKIASQNNRNVLQHLRGRHEKVIALESMIVDSGYREDVLEGLRSALKYEKSYFDKIVASLLPLLEKLTTGKVSELLSPDYSDLEDPRPIFDWRKVVNQRAVVYIGLDALTDSAVSAAVGNSLFADLVSYCGERYKSGDGKSLRDGAEDELPKISVHCDEFNELMGDEFIPMVNKGGGAGLQISAYSQALADIEAKLGSQAKAAQVVANFNNIIMYRVKEQNTAQLLTDQLPEVEVVNLTLIAGYSDTSDPNSGIDFTSKYEDRITSIQAKLIEPQDVMKLPKGHAFALLEGGHLKKIRLPLPKKEREDKENPEFKGLLEEMRYNYRTSTSWWSGGGA